MSSGLFKRSSIFLQNNKYSLLFRICLFVRILSQFRASNRLRTLLLSQFSLSILGLPAPLPKSSTRWKRVLDFSGRLINQISLLIWSLSGNSGMLLKNTLSKNLGILVPLCFFRSMGLAISLGIVVKYFSSKSAGSQVCYQSYKLFSSKLAYFYVFPFIALGSILFQLYYCLYIVFIQMAVVYLLIFLRPILPFGINLFQNKIKQRMNNLTEFQTHLNLKYELQQMRAQPTRKLQGEQKTKLTKQLQVKLKYIRSVLIKLGCQLIPTQEMNSSQYLGMCMQASDSRLELIEWLIAIIYPGYNLDSDYKNSYDDDPHIHKVKRLKIILWQLGVMPMSKHTKNLDYQKYVSGLLGFESSANLIHDLCELGQSKFSANIHKIQEKAGDLLGQLLGQLIKHHNELVNVQYDPYGVTFPPKFNHNSEQDHNKINQTYDTIMGQIKGVAIQQKVNTQQDDATVLLDQLDGYKQLLARKYGKLCEGMNRIIARYEDIVPAQNAKQIAELHNKRIINVSRDLCKGYRSYGRMLSEIRPQQFDASIKGLQGQVTNLINGINEVHNIFP